ncbi:MAG TPA: SRPBCC domain-containing protein [Acidimicrobiia bacterium]|nr:SRPBCC domain-containing protein [Acidimicrobiia bacterium]
MIEIERRIAARPATIFAYFTDSALYTTWMGVDAVLDARPGGTYRVRVPQGQVALGEFVELDPPHRLTFTWGWEGDDQVPPGSSTVTVTLVPDGDGTILRLTHDGLPKESMSLHLQGWEHYLKRLTASATRADPGTDSPKSTSMPSE